MPSPHLLFLFKEIVSARWEHFVAEITGKNPFCKKGTERGSKMSAFRHLAAGAKFSEFGHPFVCFADVSPNRGITPPYPAKCISCVGNGLDRSATPPLVGEVARAKRVTEGQITSKSTGGRGNPPLQRGADSAPRIPSLLEGGGFCQRQKAEGEK